MRKVILSLGVILFIACSMCLPCFAQTNETITITTYYPAPYGVYKELRSQRMAIGDAYYDNNNVCWDDPVGSCPGFFPFVPDAVDLVVEGDVGIGTADPGGGLSFGMPAVKLHVNVDSSEESVVAFFEGDNLRLSGSPDDATYIFIKDKTGDEIWGLQAQNDGDFGIHQAQHDTWMTFQKDTGNVGIGTADPDAILDVSSTTSAFLPPRMTVVQRDTIASPVEGSLIYNTNDKKLNFYNGSNWLPFGGVSLGAWETRSNGTTYTAATDGFVLAWNSNANNIWGYTPVGTIIIRSQGNASTGDTGITMPVRNGDTWRVIGATTVYWIPLGN